MSFGQNAQGTILGHVADNTNAALPGAEIKLVNTGTNLSRTYTTNASGDYIFVNMSPGTYVVSVTAKGFQFTASPILTLEVEQTLRQNFTLSVGSVTDQIVVSADSQMLQTDNETTGQVISDKLIEALPIDGRDFTNLLQIGVGTTIAPGGIQTTGYVLHGLNNSFAEVSVNGARADSIAFSIDGVDDTTYFFSQAANIPAEMAIQEFKTLNGQYGAEYGRGAVQVNVAIKSGTNAYHGGAYESLQNDIFQPDNAQTAALNMQNGTNDPTHLAFKQNQFGGVLGGPLTIPRFHNASNKTFWFFSYDGGRRREQTAPSSYVMPTANERAGDFSDWPYPIYDPATTGSVAATTNNPAGRTAFPNNQIPTSRFDITASNLLQYFNASNASGCTNLASGCKNFSGSVTDSIVTNTETFRADQNFANDHIFVTGNRGTDDEANPSLIAGQSGASYVYSDLLGVTWNHVFSPSLDNQATFGYSRSHFFTGSTTAYGPDLSTEAGFQNSPSNASFYGLPSITFSTYSAIGGENPYEQWNNIFQLVDTVSLTRGRHNLNIGMDLRRLFLKNVDAYDSMGVLTFDGRYTASNPSAAGGSLTGSDAPYIGNAFADFLLGQAATATGPAPNGADLYRVWGNNWNLFVQDNYMATPNLTLNFGLRWERAPNLHTPNDSGYTIDPSDGGSVVWASRSFVQTVLAEGGNSNYLHCCVPDTITTVSNKTFAPRLGVSWRPEFAKNLVVRASYGLYYDLYNRFYELQAMDDNSLWSSTAATYTTANGMSKTSNTVLSNLWSAPTNTLATFQQPRYSNSFYTSIMLHNPVPYNQQWSFDLQYSLRPNLMLDAGYVGTHALHQMTTLKANMASLPTVAGDACNSLVDASQATGDNAYCLSDPSFQPIDSRTPMSNLYPSLNMYANVETASYNGLQMQLIQRPSHGLQYHINYTFSKALGENSGFNNMDGEVAGVQDSHNVKGDYGPTIASQTHRIVMTYDYQLPSLFKSRKIVGALLGGWTTSGIYQLASGFPFTSYAYYQYGSAPEQLANSIGRYRANYSKSGAAFKSTLSEYFNTDDYSEPELGRFGNVGRGTLRTPFFTNFDVSFGKEFRINEQHRLHYRAEFFNIASTWHANTGMLFPDDARSDSTFGSLFASNPQIGKANLWNPRKIQMTLQYTF